MTTDERRREVQKRVQEVSKLDPRVTILLQGGEFTLEFNNWAIRQVLKDSGYNLMSEGFGLKEMDDPNIVGTLLYWGLKSHHPDLEQEQVDRMFNIRQRLYISERLNTALAMFMPDMTGLRDNDEAAAKSEVEDPTQPLTPVGSVTGP